MTNWKRMLVFCVLACLVMTWIPVSASAVDPVSAATMANAFAQAITAYGASQGVSMTFDVANTDGIGEGVHELWDQYQADMANSSVTVSDYQNLAASAFPTLWIKIGEKIGVNLDAASVGEIDGFWNWLLSGPAEMTKVDNQYYEWTVNQNTGEVDPISVLSNNFAIINGYYLSQLPITLVRSDNTSSTVSSETSTIYAFQVKIYQYQNDPNSQVQPVCICVNLANSSYYYYWDNTRYRATNTSGGWYYNTASAGYNGYFTGNMTAYDSINSSTVPVTYLGQYSAQDISTGTQGIGIQPYIGDAVPQDVYIPDNTDVNYEPIPAAIPTDISWDDTLFGDGSGTLTDAQSEAITQTVDQAITDNPSKTLELADTANPPAPTPGEVYIPFLPVTLPSFNFNFSGIWHYVVSWIGSLGAWFSTVLTVWANLPYAMTVPVYACLVILIVLGVYRRFLS